jgi:hypothetical protein
MSLAKNFVRAIRLDVRNTNRFSPRHPEIIAGVLGL